MVEGNIADCSLLERRIDVVVDRKDQVGDAALNSEVEIGESGLEPSWDWRRSGCECEGEVIATLVICERCAESGRDQSGGVGSVP